MNYGLPYKGSKNRLAKKILDILPAAPACMMFFAGDVPLPTPPCYQANTAEWLLMTLTA